MIQFGLSEGVGSAILVGMCLLAAPLPRGLLETLLSLKPGWVLLVAAASTSLVPFLENAKGLLDYKPRSEISGQSYENDPRFLNMEIGLLKALIVGILLFAFTLIQHLCGKMVAAQAAVERMEKNLFATQKQAKAASEQTLKMLDEVESLKQGGASSADSKTQVKVEKILSENVQLKAKLEEAEKEVDIVKSQAKAFQREHERLIEEIHQLEKRAGPAVQKEAKKDK